MGCHKKNNRVITDDVFFILDLIEKSGYMARVVGGAVRNFLLDIDISDIDIATTAIPEEVLRLFQKNGIATAPIGIEHGTILIIYKNKSYEITTLRKDVETFGRHATVEFTESFEIDSCRRDFTINAIYMDKNGEIFDYHSGIQDIKARNIRFIGDAQRRITEDYLRILRYFRFVSIYGNYNCNIEYLRVINSLKPHILMLSSERILGELLKIFSAPDSPRIVPLMREILDELFDLKLDPLEICEKLEIYSTLSAAERIGLLLKFSNFPADDLIRKYNLPKNIREMVRLRPENSSGAPSVLKRMKKDYRKFYVKYLVVKLRSDETISEQLAKAMLSDLLSFCESEYVDFNLRAKDLSKYNLSDFELKKVMMATKAFWLESEKASVADCIEFAENYLKAGLAADT